MKEFLNVKILNAKENHAGKTLFYKFKSRIFITYLNNIHIQKLRQCKESSHVPLRCDEVESSEEVRMRTWIEKRVSEAVIRVCYKCNKRFIKADGCNNIKCVCGSHMCYICRKPIENDSHIMWIKFFFSNERLLKIKI